MAKFYFRNVKFLFIGMLLLISSWSLFAQNKYWMQKAGGATPDEGYSISLDDSNNTYTTGYFSGNANFGPSLTLSTLAVSDIFITKTNSLGVFQWAVKAGDGGSDRGLSIKTDANGNSYITGYYYGTATFGTHVITSAGLQDVFVAKYDRNGNVKWVVSAGGTESDIGNAITLDNTGNVLVTGQFTGTANFGTYVLTSTNNNINVFTAKLDSSNGTFLWAKSGTGPHTNRGLGVACDPTGNVYIVGQFTDTITFDVVHNSPLYDAIFVVKYNSAGVEQWITTAGGGTFNIANAIAVDNNSNVLITGNFTGTLNFFGSSIVTLTNIYANRIFVAKYDQNANLLWDVADGSSNPVTANNISLDASGNAYIIGNFECVMNGYADQYGQGTFNTVGYWDVFSAEYAASNGAWQWSRQIGGHGNNYGYGIAVTPTSDVFTAGSFDDDMIVPMDNNFLQACGDTQYSYCPFYDCYNPNNYTYCSDPYYNMFGEMSTAGNLDIYVAKPFDLTRQTYDFYYRTGKTCNRPQLGVCITDTDPSLNYYYQSCQDTVRTCEYNFKDGFELWANSKTCVDVGPKFNYLWSDLNTFYIDFITAPGWYKVTQTSPDGCYSTTDSIYIIAYPNPPTPTISDNVIVETNDTNNYSITLCGRNCILTGGHYGSDSIDWYEPNRKYYNSVSVTATSSGDYAFYVTNSYGCVSDNNVLVIINDSLPHIIPKLKCTTCRHDTAFLCIGDPFQILPYDSITNPSANTYKCIPPYIDTYVLWNASPTTITYQNPTDCSGHDEWDWFQPSDSGWYNITATIHRQNTCDTDIHIISDSIFVRLYPIPTINLTITGKTLVCPGDKTWLKASGGTNYSWSTGATTDSIYVRNGYFNVTSRDTNSFGCIATGLATVTVHTVPQPKVTMNPIDGIVCPNDSVELSCSSADGSFAWSGPSGPLPGNTPNIYVKIPGNYNCVRTDTNGCVQLSNTVLVGLYATPYLLVTPNSVICAGDSAKISVITSNGSTITWLPPLHGSDTIQYADTGGTYYCKVVSCGITTIASATVMFSTPKAIITASPSKILCSPDDTIILTANGGMAQYVWSPGNVINPIDIVISGGTYTLTTTDSYGCTASSTITITQPPLLKDSVTSFTNVNCFGSNSGVISLGVSGGTPVYTYTWSNSNTNPSITGLSAGTYSVNVTDKNGCVATSFVTLTQPPALVSSGILNTNVLCNGGNNATANITISGGSPAYTYLWNPGGQKLPTATGLSAGTYTITVTDSLGCTLTSSVNITQPNPALLIVNPTAATCLNNDGSISVTASGGTAPYTYSWSPGSGTNSSISGLSSGNYTVTITDANGCIDTISGNVSLNKSSFSVTISGSDTACVGQNVVLTASGASTYLWSNSNTSSSITVKPAGTTTYWVKGTTGVCIDSIPYQVTTYKNLSANMQLNDTICTGKPVTLKVNVAGGKPAYTYLWSNGITNNSPGPIIVYPTTSTTYSIVVTDECNYVAKDSVHVFVVPPGIAAFTVSPDTISIGQPVTLANNSKNATSYYWNFGDGNSSTNGNPTHDYSNTGSYQIILIAYNSYGCPDTAVRDIYVTPEIIIPNVFTPNGDGVNDIFYFTIGGATCLHCDIYNRWGVLVYELNSVAQGWPGTIRQTNDPASDGVYYYILDYCDVNNVTHKKDGFIQLIRNK